MPDSPVRILVVDDDAAIRRIFTDIISRKLRVEIETAEDGRAGLDRALTGSYDLVLLDLKLPSLGGLEVLEQAKARRPELEIVMMTAFGTIDDAVHAMKLGASDFLTKPFKIAQVEALIGRVARVKALREENRKLKEELKGRFRAQAIVGLTPLVLELHRMIDRLRSESCNVLIAGESGTGKELVARAIHYDGRRSERPFVPVDCGSIHKNLLESELFGYEKGAFTGAYERRVGLFEKANGGSLFLDEVTEIPLELQPVLLRALETKRIRPVGSNQETGIDVRVLAATNRDIYGEVEAGRFRRDLFYRLNVVMVTVPPLRHRKDDIALLVEHFVKKLNERGERKVTGISRDALYSLLRYDWPGNVRELEHVIERACLLGQSEKIELADLPATVLEAAERKSRVGAAVPIGAERPLKEVETDLVVRLLTQHRGDTAKVAESLGIHRSTLYRMIRRENIDLRKLRLLSDLSFERPGAPPQP